MTGDRDVSVTISDTSHDSTTRMGEGYAHAIFLCLQSHVTFDFGPVHALYELAQAAKFAADEDSTDDSVEGEERAKALRLLAALNEFLADAAETES